MTNLCSFENAFGLGVEEIVPPEGLLKHTFTQTQLFCIHGRKVADAAGKQGESIKAIASE